MERFKETSKGYKFDRFIFLGFTILMVLSVVLAVSQHGVNFKPYLKCTIGTCDNPFYTEQKYSCKMAFGFMHCPIEQYSWLNNETVSYGEYGEKPANLNLYVLLYMLTAGLCLVLNHFWHNKGKEFHLNIMDKFKGLENEEGK